METATTTALAATLERNIVTEDGFASFLDFLVESRGFDVDEVIEVVRKPWRWEREFDQFREEGRTSV